MKLERDGRNRWRSGMSITDAILFQPRFGYHPPFGGDVVGTLYAPLIRLDRRWVHPTRYITDKGTFEWAQAFPLDEIHPQFREEIRKDRLNNSSQTPPAPQPVSR